jgi:hypothetical protein
MMMTNLTFLRAAACCLLAAALTVRADVSTDIKDESIGGKKITHITRKITASAEALLTDPDSTIIVRTGSGLLWDQDFNADARLVLTRPTDFSNLAPVKVSVYFQPITGDPGGVSFFIRPASFNPGEAEFDPVGVEAAPVPVSGTGFGTFKLYKQEFTVPAAIFNREIWLVKFQRNTGSSSLNTDTYPFPVIVWHATVTHRAIR